MGRDMHVLRTEGGHEWDVKGPPSCAPTTNRNNAWRVLLLWYDL